MGIKIGLRQQVRERREVGVWEPGLPILVKEWGDIPVARKQGPSTDGEWTQR